MSLFQEKYIDDADSKIFVFKTFDKNFNFLLSNFNNISYLKSNSLFDKINFFNLIKDEFNKAKLNYEINYYASDYLNFISNYIFRLSNINKHLMSHGTANYIDKNNCTHRHKYFYRKSNLLLYLFSRIIDRIYYRSKQFLILLFCFKIYDPFFLHISGHDRISFDFGYFYSLDNLCTKTKKDIKLKLPKTNLIELPKKDFILFLENIDSPSYRDPSIRKIISNKLNMINSDIIIHKPHLNLEGKKVKKLNTSKKIILVDPKIPAEFYIPHNREIYIIGCESSVLIYAKIINKNNKVICYDDLFDVADNYKKLYLKYSIEIIDVVKKRIV